MHPWLAPLTLKRIMGAIQGKEKRPPLQLGVVAIENETLVSPSTPVGQLLYIYIYICVCVCVCVHVISDRLRPSTITRNCL